MSSQNTLERRQNPVSRVGSLNDTFRVEDCRAGCRFLVPSVESSKLPCNHTTGGPRRHFLLPVPSLQYHVHTHFTRKVQASTRTTYTQFTHAPSQRQFVNQTAPTSAVELRELATRNRSTGSMVRACEHGITTTPYRLHQCIGSSSTQGGSAGCGGWLTCTSQDSRFGS